VALSPAEDVLYMSRSDTGEVLAWDVAPDGSLANPRTFAQGLVIPDGMCVDTAGNLYVATWASTVEVFDPSGAAWGSIALPQQATNCAFGGGDALSLYVTAHQGLYRVAMTVPGIP
jgi:gluconolactonase